MTDTKRLRERAKQAWATKDLYDPLTQDAYDYILPYRGGGGTGAKAKAAARVDKLFDGTGPQAAMRFAGRVQSDLTPPFQDFFLLEAGPAADDVLTKYNIKNPRSSRSCNRRAIVCTRACIPGNSTSPAMKCTKTFSSAPARS